MLKKIKRIASKTEIGEKAVTDRQFRTAVTACFSLVMNLAFAVYNGFTGILNISVWYTALFAYYTILSVMRFYVVTYALKETNRRTDRSVMHFCGRLLIVLSTVLALMVFLNVAVHKDTSKTQIMMIVTALYTFLKTAHAIVRTVQAVRSGSAVILTLKHISLADASASVLSLAHSMMYTFGGGVSTVSDIMDIAVGSVTVLTVAALGVGLFKYKIK